MMAKILGALALILALVCFGLFQREQALQQQLLQKNLDHQTQLASAVTAAREEDNRRFDVQRKALDAQVLETAQARADAERAAARQRGLQQQLNTVSAQFSGPASCPEATARGEAVRVLSDVLGACVSEYRSLAADAEDARIAGRLCERSYDALTPADDGR